MKLLHITDIHGNIAGLETAVDLAIASGPCILAVSGDIVEWPTRVLEKQEWQPYLDALFRSCDRLAASGCTMAVCSGNHDMWASIGKVPWFAVLHPGFVGDALQPVRSSHEVLVGGESAIITSFPWRNDGGPSSLPVVLEYAEAGNALRQRSPNSSWIWLYHRAPCGTPVGIGGSGDTPDVIVEAAAAYRPDMVLCGHFHASPSLNGGAPFWTDSRSGTLFSNPGRPKSGISISSIEIKKGMEQPVCHWQSSL